MDFPLVEKIQENLGEMEIAGDYKHVLSHQVIHARFFISRMHKINTDRISPGIHFYSFEEIVALPKPTLINNFLEEHFNSN
jgi:hypothetical protein